MFTDNMGRRERERKRWNENNAFPNTNKYGAEIRPNHNPLQKKLMKHVNNVQIMLR
jgi:hypothetical protein